MKKLFFLIITILLVSSTVYGGNELNVIEKEKLLEKYSIVLDNSLKHEYVTREDCIVAIMKAIGATDNTNEYYRNIDFNTPIFRDYFDNEKTEGYILLAGLEEIALGWYVKDVFGENDKYFFPNKDATVKNAIIFMIRCLDDFGDETIINENGEKIVTQDIDLMIKHAEEIGLIKKSDEFYSKLDTQMSTNNFCELLYRFINQKRYAYYQGEKVRENGYDVSFTRDKERCMTYLEFLEQKLSD